MSARSVHYICRQHGEFVAHVKCGFGAGPAPLEYRCPAENCYRIADRKKVAERKAKRESQRFVAIPAEAHERLKKYCESQGITLGQWIDANTQDLGGGE